MHINAIASILKCLFLNILVSFPVTICDHNLSIAKYEIVYQLCLYYGTRDKEWHILVSYQQNKCGKETAMEQNKIETMAADNDKILSNDDAGSVSGGKGGFSGGYCPHTPDRTCKVEAVGHWDKDNEECKYCGWVAPW